MAASALLVFSSSGDMGMAATTMYKHLAHLLSGKRNSLYSLMVGWLHCCLDFSLVHSGLALLLFEFFFSVFVGEVLKKLMFFKVSGSPLDLDLCVAEGRFIQP